MRLETRHIRALERAEPLMVHRNFRGYLELRDLLKSSAAADREKFRRLFTSYYGLHLGGLTEPFLDRFFEILFTTSDPKLGPILKEMSGFRRKKGDHAVPFSFVSKLVAMRIESSPIFDRHVAHFFGVKVPPSSVERAERIGWFVSFIADVKQSYEAWVQDGRVHRVLNRFAALDPRLKASHTNRLLDFLVWKVGNQGLLE